MEPLSVEDHLAQSSEEASPPKWHLGHTTWFFENLILKPQNTHYQEFNEHYSYYFNSYYNALGPRIARTDRASLTRPALSEVQQYRTYVDAAMLELLKQEKLNSAVLDLIELGLNHEQQHQELFLTDFKKALSAQAFYPIYDANFKEDLNHVQPLEWLEFPAGLYEIGNDGSTFHFDNEAPRHKVYLASFELASELVSNGDWLEFLEDDGYHKPEFWLSDGWDWRLKEKIESPLYWTKQNGQWQEFTLAGLKDLDRQARVKHISFYEASAYAQWKGLRLPTEAEWEVAQEQFKWGERWEWTESAYLPYPGFKSYSGPAKEYNGKFMVNQKVLRGASIATPEGHSRSTYRNFFHPQFRWQYTGLRLAKNKNDD